MKIKDRVLTADEDYILTNGETAGYTVALGKYDSPENWHEIPIEKWEETKAGDVE